MKTDIKKVKVITLEMMENDKLYDKMLDEYVDYFYDLECGDYDDVFNEEFEKAYFFRRVLSVLAGDDIPLSAAVGLNRAPSVLDSLYLVKENYIGDSDADTDLFKFVIDFGFRLYEVYSELDKKDDKELYDEDDEDDDFHFED